MLHHLQTYLVALSKLYVLNRRDVINIKRTVNTRGEIKPVETNDMVSDNVELALQLTSDDTESNTINVLQRRLISQCQAIIAKASVCTSRKALVTAITHSRTVFSSLDAPDSCGVSAQTVSKRIPSNEKLDKQLRLSSTRAKRRLRADEVRETKKKLVTNDEPVMEHGKFM